MDNFDIPIFKKTYDMYKLLHILRPAISKQDRHTIFARAENTALEILEGILMTSQMKKEEKIPTLENISAKLNILRVFIRLMKDTKTLDLKKYTVLQTLIDEIGRMLGGWIKSCKEV